VPEIAVIGAGVAGLTLAAVLVRRGLTSVIFEQATALTEIGAGVQIAPNASRVLHRLGLAARLDEVAVRPAATEFRRWADDRLIAKTALGAECERLYGAPYYTIHRADLRNALASLVSGMQIRLGWRLARVRDAADRAILDFDDRPSYQAQMVVGADGVRSVVRGRLAADQPVFCGLGVYRGLVPAHALPDTARQPAVRVWLGPGRHLVCYPVRGGALVSFAATAPSDTAGRESWNAVGSITDLAQAFRGWNDTVQALIAGATAIRHWTLHDRDPVRHLCAPRLALIGDAAHPMLPFTAQGANQAIEDAAALATCLAQRRDGDCARAASRYEAVRAVRTARLQREARSRINGMHLPDGPAQHVRDRVLASEASLHQQAWLYGYDAEEVCLP
jgi:salicylate hydroxylase